MLLNANELIPAEDNASFFLKSSSESAKQTAESPNHYSESILKKARSGKRRSAELSELCSKLIKEKEELEVALDAATRKLE